MANKHLKLKPHKPKSGLFWWYEGNDGISIYTGTGPAMCIPWRAIRAALKRKDKRNA